MQTHTHMPKQDKTHNNKIKARKQINAKTCETRVFRLIRVRAQPHSSIPRHECLHRVPIHCLCYFSGSSLQAQLCKRLANSLIVLGGSITSLSIGVDGNCLIGPPIGFALQFARVLSYSALVVPTREDAPQPDQ